MRGKEGREARRRESAKADDESEPSTEQTHFLPESQYLTYCATSFAATASTSESLEAMRRLTSFLRRGTPRFRSATNWERRGRGRGRAHLSCSRSLSFSLPALSRQKSSFLCGGVHESCPDSSSDLYSS